MGRQKNKPEREGVYYKLSEDDMKKYAVYRIKNIEGKSIYIGISGTVMRRAADHIENQKWQDEMASIDVEFFDNKMDAEMSEIIAIKRYRPKYNSTYNNDEPVKSAVKKNIDCIIRECQEFSENNRMPIPHSWRYRTPSDEEVDKHMIDYTSKRLRKAQKLNAKLQDAQKWWDWALS